MSGGNCILCGDVMKVRVEDHIIILNNHCTNVERMVDILHESISGSYGNDFNNVLLVCSCCVFAKRLNIKREVRIF